jgi:hypothetical protein
VSSTTAQSPTSQENSLWAQIIHNLKEVAVHIEQSEGLTLKVDKVHKRMVDYLADKELTPSACSKLKELYSSTTTALEKESRFGTNRLDVKKSFNDGYLFFIVLKASRKGAEKHQGPH